MVTPQPVHWPHYLYGGGVVQSKSGLVRKRRWTTWFQRLFLLPPMSAGKGGNAGRLRSPSDRPARNPASVIPPVPGFHGSIVPARPALATAGRIQTISR